MIQEIEFDSSNLLTIKIFDQIRHLFRHGFTCEFELSDDKKYVVTLDDFGCYQVLGFLCWTQSNNHVYIHEIYTHPNARRIGIATNMIKYISEKNINKPFFSYVSIENKNALKLFEKLKFEQIDNNNKSICLYHPNRMIEECMYATMVTENI